MSRGLYPEESVRKRIAEKTPVVVRGIKIPNDVLEVALLLFATEKKAAESAKAASAASTKGKEEKEEKNVISLAAKVQDIGPDEAARFCMSTEFTSV